MKEVGRFFLSLTSMHGYFFNKTLCIYLFYMCFSINEMQKKPWKVKKSADGFPLPASHSSSYIWIGYNTKDL